MTPKTKAVVPSSGPGTAVAQFTSQEVDILRETIAKDTTQQEFALFAMVCETTGLSPFAKQIYAIKRGGRMTIQVSIDGFRVIAQRTGQYRGQRGPVWCGEDGNWQDVWLSSDYPVAAKVGVLREGFTEPLWAVARWDSYAQFFSGKLADMWKSYPDVMIAKCAESLALRRAFPQELSGLYADLEVEQQETTARRPAAVVVSESQSNVEDAETPPREEPMMTDPQKRNIHALLKHLFGTDEQLICEFVQSVAPECVEGTDLHLSPLTMAAASNLIEALNSKKEERHNGDATPATEHAGIGAKEA